MVLQSGASMAPTGLRLHFRHTKWLFSRTCEWAPATSLLRCTKTMRDIFADPFATEPVDPTEAARRGARPKLRARFYRRAGVGEPSADTGGQFPVLLDNRPVRTPARALLAAPSRELAEAIA